MIHFTSLLLEIIHSKNSLWGIDRIPCGNTQSAMFWGRSGRPRARGLIKSIRVAVHYMFVEYSKKTKMPPIIFAFKIQHFNPPRSINEEAWRFFLLHEVWKIYWCCCWAPGMACMPAFFCVFACHNVGAFSRIFCVVVLREPRRTRFLVTCAEDRTSLTEKSSFTFTQQKFLHQGYFFSYLLIVFVAMAHRAHPFVPRSYNCLPR